MKKIIWFVMELLFGAAFLFGGVHLLGLWKDKTANEAVYAPLRSIIEQTQQSEEDGQPYRFPHEALREENPDVVGWLTVEDTAIDYPVVQRVGDDEYYLHHDLYGEWSKHGTLYVDSGCTIGASQQIVIYGHHMKDGSMFKGLTRFQEEDFCRSHTIRFDTVEKSGVYQPFLVMTISADETEQLPYHQYTEFDSAEDFQAYIDRCRSYALWVSEDAPVYGEELLTLSTCEYSHKDGRLVVMAREVSGE